MVNQLLDPPPNFYWTLWPNRWVFIRLRRGWLWTGGLIQQSWQWGDYYFWQRRKVVWEKGQRCLGTCRTAITHQEPPTLTCLGLDTEAISSLVVSCHKTRVPVHNSLIYAIWWRPMKTHWMVGDLRYLKY